MGLKDLKLQLIDQCENIGNNETTSQYLKEKISILDNIMEGDSRNVDILIENDFDSDAFNVNYIDKQNTNVSKLNTEEFMNLQASNYNNLSNKNIKTTIYFKS